MDPADDQIAILRVELAPSRVTAVGKGKSKEFIAELIVMPANPAKETFGLGGTALSKFIDRQLQ